ncbi:MAG: gliding motility-associated ABC transporter substrate-binding protein GldG [Bacteroidales bacterium]
MDRKKVRKQNIIQLVIIFVFILLLNYIVSFLILRIDLTSEGRYTLSDKTIKLLKDIDDQVYVKVYLEGNDLPVGFKRMRRALNDMLEEFSSYSGKEFNFRFINPGENPDKKVRFGLYKQLYDKGLVPIESTETTEEGKTSSKMVFPGVVMVYMGKEIGINLLKNDPRYRNDSEDNINNSIQSIEYELTNGLRKLTTDKKQKIAFIEGHGELNEYEVMDISTALSEYYEVQRGNMSGMPGILDQFAAIIIAKPQNHFSENDKLVIDQYIMQGGKVLWLLDATKIDLDSMRNVPVTVAMPMDLNLEDQLFRYGVRLNPGLLQDIQSAGIALARAGSDNKPRIDVLPCTYFPVILSDNSHAINKYLNLLRFEFGGTLDTVSSSQNVKKTILLRSSDKSKFDYAPVQVSLDEIQRKPNEGAFKSKNLAVAVLIEGVFESNFKNRLLQDLVLTDENIIKQSKPTKMIIASDGDIPLNQVSPKGEIYPVGYDINTRQTFMGNKDFMLNSINYLCDDEGLMSVRLREIKMRLLSKAKISKERNYWKFINTVLPVCIVILAGFATTYLRKRKYSQTW